MESHLWNARAVIVKRDDQGFGLTVSGDNPVSVQTIKRGGPAECAGIREGDIIIKVNGHSVEHMNHLEVVNFIKSAGNYVTLTVRPPDMVSLPGLSLIAGSSPRQHSSQDRITAPIPVDAGIQMQMQDNKLRTLQIYRDQAAFEYDKCYQKYEASQSPRDQKDLEKAEKSLRSIETQMKALRQSSQNVQLHSPTPFSPFPNSHQPVPFQPYQVYGIPGTHVSQSPYQFQPSMGVIGPSNFRNRNPLTAQVSVPSYTNPDIFSDIPPPLPPRSCSHSSSFSNDSQFTTPPGYSRHDPLGGNDNGLNTSNTSSSGSQSLQYGEMSVDNSTIHNAKGARAGGSLNLGHGKQISSQQHHRAKSSPDPVSMKKALTSEASKRSDSVSDLSQNTSEPNSTDIADSKCQNTPPGSPPPPYGKYSDLPPNEDSFTSTSFSSTDFSPAIPFNAPRNQSYFANLSAAMDIMSVEEDDCLLPPEAPLQTSGRQGPFSSLPRLLDHNAHLAVFMNFVIDNSFDLSSLLFYLITSLSLEEGTLKEMKRWGYEIHSTFTAPGSPLHVPNVDENISAEIDDTLVRETDRENMMIRVFRKARNKGKDEINKQLEDFFNRRTTGLGSMFGPPDIQLEESIYDKSKELRIVETYLVPRLESYLEEWEKNSEDKTWAICGALSTILQRQFGLKSATANCVIERCSSFVSKDKSVRSKFMSKNKKLTHNGHHFIAAYINSYTECSICSKLLWGVGPQGLQCSACMVITHRNCLPQIQDYCLGSEQEGLKKKDRLRQFKDKIRPSKSDPKRKSVNPYPLKAFSEESNRSSTDTEFGDKQLAGNSSSNSKHDKKPDTLCEEHLTPDGQPYDTEPSELSTQEPRRTSNAVGRSESCKERVQKKQTRERRKHSDPNLTSNKSSDVDLENQPHLSDANSGSSSTSSLSGGGRSDSPSTSSDFVAPGHHSASSLPSREASEIVGHLGPIESYKISHSWEGDSDIEVEDAPDWTKNVPEETLSSLSSREKKRQEILNELIHTERSHVRNLKVIDRLFHKPLRSLQFLTQDLISMLFGNLDDMLEIHGKFNTALKKKRKETPLIEEIGPVLREIFDGETAEYFKKSAAICCARQQIGLKILKERREKSPKLNAFLQDAEQDSVCRRLQLQDMIPMAMQRLTKYPLIFDHLCNNTDSDTAEFKSIQRALETSKEILNSVNLAKKEAEDYQRLVEIQRRLDKSSLEKGISSLEKGLEKPDILIMNELRNLDLTKHKLVFEGPLMWRVRSSKQKSEAMQDVQLILLHDMVVLLLKQDDRFVLKIHISPSYPGKSAERSMSRPVIKLNNLIHRANAADKRAFLLVNMTSTNMYELVCSTTEERKLWLHHITKAADDYKNRQQECRNPPNSNIPSAVPDLDDKTKESPDVAEGGDSDGDSMNPNESVSGVQKETSPAPETTSSQGSNMSESKPGDAMLTTGIEKNRGVSASPKSERKIGEFLRVTETSPLIDPAEVIVIARDVQYAQPVISQYEELRRVDSSISKAFEEKMKLITQIHHIPATKDSDTADDSYLDLPAPKDAKDLVVICIQKVDQLGQLLQNFKATNENMPILREETHIQQSLSILLTQVLSEIHRKDEQEEVIRHELHRIREQNHGYQERLQSKDVQSSPGTSLSSPTISPVQSRPHSFLSASSSDHHDDEPEIVKTKLPSKSQLFNLVVTSNINNPQSSNPIESSSSTSSETLKDDNQLNEKACDLSQEEFADAVEDLSDPLQESSSLGEAQNISSATTPDPEMIQSMLDSSISTNGHHEGKKLTSYEENSHHELDDTDTTEQPN